MNLYYYTLTTAFLMGVMGLLICSKPKIALGNISGLLRSKKAAIIFLFIGLVWFLYEHVQNLGDADFGEYKYIIGIIATGVAISSYFFIGDFLYEIKQKKIVNTILTLILLCLAVIFAGQMGAI